MRILLLVDDERLCREALQRLLHGLFDEVLLARDHLEAEEHLRDRPVSHLLCDLWLGEGRPPGDELVAAWRRAHPGIRFAGIITGSEVDEDRVPDGADAVFLKPFEPAALRRALAPSIEGPGRAGERSGR